MTPAKYVLAGGFLYVAYRAVMTYQDTDMDLFGDIGSSFSTLGNIVTNTTLPGPAIDPVTKVDYGPKIISAARARLVPPVLLWALIKQESAFKASATGPTTKYGRAKGLAQFIDSTAAEWGVDPYDPDSAIEGAAAYLAWLNRQLGTWRKAVAAYNWGVGNVRQNGMANMPAETRNYVANVYDKYAAQLPA